MHVPVNLKNNSGSIDLRLVQSIAAAGNYKKCRRKEWFWKLNACCKVCLQNSLQKNTNADKDVRKFVEHFFIPFSPPKKLDRQGRDWISIPIPRPAEIRTCLTWVDLSGPCRGSAICQVRKPKNSSCPVEDQSDNLSQNAMIISHFAPKATATRTHSKLVLVRR